jgi:hypothetical protein
VTIPKPGHGQAEKAPQIANGGAYRAYSGRYHQLCARCQHSCKQSPKLKLIRCPQFKEKEVKDGKA